jgi:hypothetical protein
MAGLDKALVTEGFEDGVQVRQDVVEITFQLVVITVCYLADFRCHAS